MLLPLAAFQRSVDESIRIISATESLWLASAPTSQLRRQLTVAQLEALYEAAFLRIFAAWEEYLEASCVRLMAGKGTPTYTPLAAPGVTTFRTQQIARAVLFNSRTYLLWHNPRTVINRVSGWLDSCPIETVVTANQPEIENIAAVRHAIAHGSQDARAKLGVATAALSGVLHTSPGHFLRSADNSDPLNPRKWVRVLTTRLEDFAHQINS
ncbi:hypothetical protein GUY44_19965 [Pimelobacter simplex]|nr:hypothetical protein [Pimelobacter simplex]MCG8152770.1 hypothetical protein [Pimelobacter simplex]GEB16858.1 hypothetical protein NSI01_51730 [Pimelobacter simplex]